MCLGGDEVLGNCPKCGTEVLSHFYLHAPDMKHCRPCWNRIPEPEQQAILEPLYREAKLRVRAKAQENLLMDEPIGKITCGRCDRPMMRNDSYCRFCAGEVPLSSDPHLQYLEAIARVCYEANRAYSEGLGERGLPRWSNLTPPERMRRLEGVKWRIENLDVPLPMIHAKWVERMLADGWVHGPTKNTVKKTHPCLVDWDDLPTTQQRKDALFAATIKALIQPVE